MTDFFRIQLGIVSRSEGHSAAKRSAYQACGKIVDHEGQTFDFTRKASEHVQTIMLAPDAAPAWASDPQSLWQRAAAAEKRIDAQEARIVDFSMPRAVSPELWETCIRHVYEPYIRMGMTLQIDIHDTAASDGGRNVNIHGLATLRPIEGNGFASRKNRQWNDHFRERNGRAVREQFAERLTGFCREHGLDYEGDARPNSERDLPDPEPNLPRWNFEAAERGDEMPEALAALHQHRDRHREWEQAKTEEDEAFAELRHLETRRRESKRRLMPADAGQYRSAKRDRRAAILRGWHGGDNWIDADTIAEIATVRFDDKRDLLWIDLKDGTTLIDRGDAVSLRGQVTWTAVMETAAAAERHGWQTVEVSGDQSYKDAVTVACLLRGIAVANHELSPAAKALLDGLTAEQEQAGHPANQQADDFRGHRADTSGREGEERITAEPTQSLATQTSGEIHQKLTKRRLIDRPPAMTDIDQEHAAPVLKPRPRSRYLEKHLPQGAQVPLSGKL